MPRGVDDAGHAAPEPSTELSPPVWESVVVCAVTGLAGVAAWLWLNESILHGQPLFAACGGILAGAIFGFASDVVLISIGYRFWPDRAG